MDGKCSSKDSRDGRVRRRRLSWASHGYQRIVKQFLKRLLGTRKVDVDLTDEDGMPLLWAVENGDGVMAEYLPNKTDDKTVDVNSNEAIWLNSLKYCLAPMST
jgi:hypothetical protein